MTRTSFTEDGGPPALRSKWLVLLTAALGNLVLTIDSGIMGVSYPALAEAFDTDTSTVLWVSVAFWVTGVGLVMTVGWLGGRRRATAVLHARLCALLRGAGTFGDHGRALAACRHPYFHGAWGRR